MSKVGKDKKVMARPRPPDYRTGSGVAIVGMAGRFPGADNIARLWQNLCNAVDAGSSFAAQEIELFDAAFFGIDPSEAEIMDPQQRLFLECAWEALENAGYDPKAYTGSIGVYAGLDHNIYLDSRPRLAKSADDWAIRIGNEPDHLTTRAAHQLDLKGPAVTVQTAGSTSLVAVHLACQSLLNGTCDMTLAGGVSVTAQEGEEPFPGQAFDARIQGFVRSSGVGIVVLKRLTDAFRDGDHVYAVIKGSAVNNDGAKTGLTTPNVAGQARVIRAAQAVAGIEPETITYVEVNGSQTALGNRVKVAALKKVFQAGARKRGLTIGSIKTNIGDVHAAAGVASLIKTALMLDHKLIPASPHLEHCAGIALENDFSAAANLSEWKVDAIPRRAGVSSFGVGGTNAHVVLEEAPPVDSPAESRPWQVLMLSAKTDSALEAETGNLVEHLKQSPDLDLADVAYTLQVGRRNFACRRMAVCRDLQDAIGALEKQRSKRLLPKVREVGQRPIAFMFPGLGDHYVNMGLELYRTEPTFRAQIDRCSELLEPHLGLNLRTVLYPDPAAQVVQEQIALSSQTIDLRRMLWRSREPTDENTQKLNQTFIAQPAVFVIEYALAQLWMAWGVRPDAMIGYSIGEYVAACLAGVISLEDALSLVAQRARMIHELPGGAMLIVLLPKEEIVPRLGEKLSLAATNGPSACVVAGPADAMVELEQELLTKGVPHQRLRVSHAFHSKMMEPLAGPSTELAKSIALKPPQIAYISNVTGGWITSAEATDPTYWARHICRTVRFGDGVELLWQAPDRILLEVGPGDTLSTLAIQHPASSLAKDPLVLSSMRSSHVQQSDVAFALNTLGRLWLAGIQPDWASFHAHERRRRLPLPTYPFERQRYWIKPEPKQTKSPDKKPDIADWFYVPSWKRSPFPISPEPKDSIVPQSRWLIFVDECGLGSRMAERLEQAGQAVTTVMAGERLRKLNDSSYIINPQESQDYAALIGDLCRFPQAIVHLWCVTPDDLAPSLEKIWGLGPHSLRCLSQALAEQNITDSLYIGMVSNHVQAVTGQEVLHPEKATLQGPCKSLALEQPHITCSNIDIVLPWQGSEQEKRLVDCIIAECAARLPDPIVAYRGRHRWVQTFEAVRMESTDRFPQHLQEKGVYLITDGLNGIGFVLAEYLATAQARLVLTEYSALPARSEWEPWLAAHVEQDAVGQKIQKICRLEKLGAQVLVVNADVADQKDVQSVKEQAYRQFGKIQGIIHAAGDACDEIRRPSHPGMADRDLAAKVKGALALEAVFKDVKLDFFVLCSSVGSVVGKWGQADYCAADSFLDAFAHRQAARGNPFTVSVNWAVQQQVDSTLYTPESGDSERPRPHGRTSDHPLLGEHLLKTARKEIYATAFSAKHWILNEHRLLGRAVIPETAYLEIVRAAFEQRSLGGAVELRNLVFGAPVVVGDDETKNVYLVIEKCQDAFDFSIIVQYGPEDGSAPQWQECAKGKISCSDAGPQKEHDLRRMIEERHLKESQEELAHLGPMDLGPRFRCLKQVYVGANEALALLELDQEFLADLKRLGLHPSLMSIAVGFGNLYLGQDLCVPSAYEKVKITGSLPGRLYSHLKYRNVRRKGGMTADVVIMDERGVELVEITKCSMKRESDLEARLTEWAQLPSRRGARSQPFATYLEPSIVADSMLRQDLEEKISPQEARDVFQRVMSRNVSPQIIVTPHDIEATLDRANSLAHARLFAL